MSRQSKFKVIEDSKGKSMDKILTDLYDKHNNLEGVAAELGVTQGTISLWLIRCGLEVRSVIVPRGATVQIQEPAL